jgi:hypothetical protein
MGMVMGLFSWNGFQQRDQAAKIYDIVGAIE